jgi:hypothetical protein
MMTLIREGGFPMWFVLAFGLGAVGKAAWYASSPKRGSLALTVALGLTTVFATLVCITADLAAVGHHLNEHWDDYKEPIARIVAQGIAESMSGGIVGFALVAMTSLLAGIGAWRRQ